MRSTPEPPLSAADRVTVTGVRDQLEQAPGLQAMEVVGASLEEYEARGLPPEQAMKAFGDWLEGLSKDGKPVFVGFNATFDWSFVNWYFHT